MIGISPIPRSSELCLNFEAFLSEPQLPKYTISTSISTVQQLIQTLVHQFEISELERSALLGGRLPFGNPTLGMRLYST